jgi:hypothetical protein
MITNNKIKYSCTLHRVVRRHTYLNAPSRMLQPRRSVPQFEPHSQCLLFTNYERISYISVPTPGQSAQADRLGTMLWSFLTNQVSACFNEADGTQTFR